jgi:hypothetical protein
LAARSRQRTRQVSGTLSPWPFIGMAGLVCTFFLYAASGLVAPSWAVAVLVLVWFVQLGLALRWWTPHPQRLLPLALLSLVLWFAALVAGGRFLGWQG